MAKNFRSAQNVMDVSFFVVKHETRVAEVQQELKDAVTKCESLEQKIMDQATELTSLSSVVKEARTEVRGHQ